MKEWLIPVNSNPVWKECFEEFKNNVITDIRKKYDCYYDEEYEVVSIIKANVINKNRISDIVAKNLSNAIAKYVEHNCIAYYKKIGVGGTSFANVPISKRVGPFGLEYGVMLCSDAFCDLLSKFDDDEKELKKKVS